jgi:hypothetical protein
MKEGFAEGDTCTTNTDCPVYEYDNCAQTKTGKKCQGTGKTCSTIGSSDDACKVTSRLAACNNKICAG